MWTCSEESAFCQMMLVIALAGGGNSSSTLMGHWGRRAPSALWRMNAWRSWGPFALASIGLGNLAYLGELCSVSTHLSYWERAVHGKNRLLLQYLLWVYFTSIRGIFSVKKYFIFMLFKRRTKAVLGRRNRYKPEYDLHVNVFLASAVPSTCSKFPCQGK